jgi:hypothetical protein
MALTIQPGRADTYKFARGRETNNRTKKRWWNCEGDPTHEIVSAIEIIDQQQATDRESLAHWFRMYSNRLSASLSGRYYSEIEYGDRVRYNLIKSVVDSIVSHIGSTPVRVVYSTYRDWEAARRAEKLARFTAGQFYALRQYELAPQVCCDGCIFGDGYQHVWADARTARIMSERVLPDELICDEADGRAGKPRTLYRVKEVSRDWAIDKWGDSVDLLRNAGLVRNEERCALDDSDPISIIEAWHLPAPGQSQEGRRVLCCTEGSIEDGHWSRDRFPIARWQWSPSPVGWRGIGVAEELSPLQVEINYLAQKIQKNLTLAASQMWARKGSIVGSVNNKDWAIREFVGEPPIVVVPQAISPEYYQQIDRIWQRGYQIVGMSELAASSQKPAGLNSGEALRVYSDVTSRRFRWATARWEQFGCDVAELINDAAEDLRAIGETAEAVWCGDAEIESIEWGDVSVEKSKYRMRAWPTSLLPDTPAGRLSATKELLEVVPEARAYAAELIGAPDLDAIKSRINATMRLIQMQIDRMLHEGEPEIPYDEMDLKLVIDQGRLALQEAMHAGAPEERQELLRIWIATAAKKLRVNTLPMPQAMPGAVAGPGPEMAQAPMVAPDAAVPMPEGATLA